ncbi:extensin [Streptomyces sp. NPDC008150]|uniref:extensin n=1 Tax=Streptomyces sp. NPDC008150 TaxID=3364816 RepID=UPI0036E69040
MADEQDKWLDRETAERLLRGEPPHPVGTDTGEGGAGDADAGADAVAERLARTLAALHVPSRPDLETPGEQAALAAFRAARPDVAHVPDAAEGPVVLGLVRGGRHAARGAAQPTGHRPLVRLGLSAVLAAGMLGGVAAAATSGVLRTPFGEADPAPATSATGPMSGEPFASPSEDGPSGSATGPDGGAASVSGSQTAGATGDAPLPGTAHDGHSARWWSGVASDCEELLDGRRLSDAGRRTLDDAAGGSSRVRDYCEAVLDDPGGDPASGTYGSARGSGDGRNGDGGDGQSDRPDRSGRSDGSTHADRTEARTDARTGDARADDRDADDRAGGPADPGRDDEAAGRRTAGGTVSMLATTAESPAPAGPGRAAKGGRHRKPSGRGGAHAAGKGPRGH